MEQSGASRSTQKVKHKPFAEKPDEVWACDRCYRIRRKCDSARPSCGACAARGRICVYSPHSRSRDRGASGSRSQNRGGRRYDRTAYIRMLESRVRELEEILIGSSSDTSRESGENDTLVSEKPQNATCPPISVTGPETALDGNDAIVAGVSNLSIRSPALIASNVPYNMMCPYAVGPILEGPIADCVSSPEVIRHLAQVFFECYYSAATMLPFHEATFMRSLHRQPMFVVMSICACAAPLSDHPALKAYAEARGLPPYIAAEYFFWKARSMIPQLLETPNLDTVLGLGMLSSSANTLGLVSARNSILALCIRMAMELRLNVDPDIVSVHGPLTFLQKETRRRIWSCLWFLEAVDTSMMDLPPIIKDEDKPVVEIDNVPRFGDSVHHWAVKFPGTESTWQSIMDENDEPPVSNETEPDSMTLWIVVVQIWTKAFKFAGTIGTMVQRAIDDGRRDRMANEQVSPAGGPEALAKILEERRKTRAELEQALVNWMNSTPSWFHNIDKWDHFALSLVSKSPPPWNTLHAHLYYHCGFILLHLPTVLESHYHPSENGLSESAGAAYAICLDHARRIAHLLRKAIRLDPDAKLIGYYSMWCVYYSALILIMATKTTVVEEELAQVQNDLQVHLNCLRQVGRRRYLIKHMEENLLNIIAEGEKANGPILAGWSRQ
ncbi:uncharacterized protein SPPG_09017 [Spizellomyces punctatus DAOM BR117]|uniref:Zn(2)-C6 fungal-type domain-containing protein n=1 Tax=Spizellomyces punctatus (strain DAOM BR117) TaxID=645134 RepID=A0A0L0HQC5_SPIPD|nr:uncharacterized protein SPPG_09017 [Spizellomyces punctatus DAOM BR117]KND03317.1 hypothetical protein SPPG_09017 [Spizellomyces punctatus DAOM BR117]|eukprot:XP_016611356.1 hypothetical protein SPPG_09017 [Spizellomyces punctatus DAOM BR117]